MEKERKCGRCGGGIPVTLPKDCTLCYDCAVEQFVVYSAQILEPESFVNGEYVKEFEEPS